MAAPGPTAALVPRIATPSFLARIRRTPSLPSGCWYLAASVALSALNRPDEVGWVFRSAAGLERRGEGDAVRDGDGLADARGTAFADAGAKWNGPADGTMSTADGTMSTAEQLRVARRMREGLVKSAAIVGLPKTINALVALKSHTPPHLLDAPFSRSPTLRTLDVHATPASRILQRGAAFFALLYGSITTRVMASLDGCGTEDLGLVARLAYGYVLSNTRVLTPAETSFVLIAALVPQDVNPQLKGHLRGALNAGATRDEVEAVRSLAVHVCREAGMRLLPAGEAGWGWREEVARLK